jgi:hypothetical protein
VNSTRKTELRTGPLKTGKLVSGKLSTGTLDRPAQTSAVRALKEKTARGVRLVGETGDGQFRVSLSPVKKRKPKDKAEPQPLTRWSSSAFPWPDDPAEPVIIAPVDWPRRPTSIAVTVVGNATSLITTELQLRVTPGAGQAESVFAATRWSTGTSGGASVQIVYQFWPVFGDPFLGYDVSLGVMPPDLWLGPSDTMELSWSGPPALIGADIKGVIVRWENQLN